jgi:hypothetical protein
VLCLLGDQRGRKVDRTGKVPLVPGLGGAAAENHETRITAGRQRRNDIRDVGVKARAAAKYATAEAGEADGTRRTAFVVGSVVVMTKGPGFLLDHAGNLRPVCVSLK